VLDSVEAMDDTPGIEKRARRSRTLGGWGAIAIALLAAACGGTRSFEIVRVPGTGDASTDDRVVLHAVIDLDASSASAGRRLRRWLGEESPPDGFRRPYAVAWDGDQLLVADPDAGLVARLRDDGKLEFAPRELFVQPVGLAVCEEGILVADSAQGGVAVLDRRLKLIRWVARDLARPTGVACSASRVFVAETGRHRILALGPGDRRETIGRRGSGPGEFNFPTSLTLDGDTLIVGDTLNFRIQRIEPATGRFLDSFGALGDTPGEMPRLKGIAVDRAGHLWAADAHLDRVSIFLMEGGLLLSLGGNGDRVDQFSFPAGIAAHSDGRVAVVDSLNRRVKIFRVAPPDEAAGVIEDGGG
jgi:DNA-binding beta-propeller fold protein YncE